MTVVAQFCISDSQTTAEVNTEGLSFRMNRLTYKDTLSVLKTVMTVLAGEAVYVEKIEVDDGEFITAYPLRVKLSRSNRPTPSPKPDTHLFSPTKGIDQHKVFQEFVGYMRMSSQPGIIKGAVHYEKLSS